jgi:hypothetical protein
VIAWSKTRSVLTNVYSLKQKPLTQNHIICYGLFSETDRQTDRDSGPRGNRAARSDINANRSGGCNTDRSRIGKGVKLWD